MTLNELIETTTRLPRSILGAVGELAAAVAQAWAPGEVHLAGRAPCPVPFIEARPIDERLAALEREIAIRRGIA